MHVSMVSTLLTEHRVPGGGGYGQNIAAGPEPGKVADVISNMWYNGELELYPTPYGIDSPNMGNFEGWGHFSQVVWSDSESVGCYTSTCFPAGQDPQDCQSDGTSYLSGLTCGNGGVPAYFTVCNYYPAGKPAAMMWQRDHGDESAYIHIGNFGGEYSKVKAPGSMGIVAMSEEGVVSGL